MAVYDLIPMVSVSAATNSRRGVRTAWLLVLALICFSSPSARGDETIDLAWNVFSRSEPEQAIAMLETAVLEKPERADYWAALLSALSETSFERYLVTCYCNAALRAHPDSLEVHWARLRCLRPEEALDELAALDKREPDKQKIHDAREVLELQLRLPRDWQNAKFYEEWGVQCIRFQAHDAAIRVAKQGRKFARKSPQLSTVEAFAFVHTEKYELAFAALNQANFQQALNSDQIRFPTVGDLLLSKKQPEWAIRAFGPKPDKELIRSRQGLVLAQALLQANKLEQSEEVFSQTDPLGAALLVIGNLLDLKQTDAAREVAEQLFKDWPTGDDDRTGHAKDMCWSGNWPVSLEPQFKRAIVWLWKTYPKHKDLLGDYLCAPDELFSRGIVPVRLRSEQTARSSGVLTGKTPGGWVPGYGWYEPGARETRDYFRRVLLQPPPDQARIRTELRPAQRWAEARRDDQAIAYYSTHPRELIHARRLLDYVNHLQRDHASKSPEQVLGTEQLCAEVERMNPAVIALLLHALAVNDDKVPDRTPLVRLIAVHGTHADVPDLRSALSTATNSPSESALHEALEKITGVENPEKTFADRLLFWDAWWQTNLVRVIAEAEF